MKNKGIVALYSLICNIPVSTCLCLASSIIGVSSISDGNLTISFSLINWGIFGINVAIGLTLAMIVGVFVPLTMIGRWFTGLFHVKNDTYKGNMPYRLLGTLIISVIYYFGITPTLSIINYFLFKTFSNMGEMFLNMLIAFPIMLLVGFISSLISDIFAYKVAHKIDPNF